MIAGATPGYLAEVRPCKSNEQAKADAEFIVRACNAHDYLVQALREIVLNDPFRQSSAGVIALAALDNVGAAQSSD